MDLLSLAWKNLWRNRRRTLITLAAIAFGVMLVQASHNLTYGVYGRMIDSGVRAGSGHLAVYRGDYARSRDELLSFAAAELPQAVARLAGVEQALPRVYLPGLAQSSRDSRGILLTGVEPAAEAAINPFLRKLSASDLPAPGDSREALIGRKLLAELQLEVGEKFVVTVQNRSGELVSELLRVKGVVHSGIAEVDGSLVMVSRQRAAAMGGIPGRIHELAVVLTAAASEARVHAQLTALTAARPELRVLSWRQAMPNLADAITLDHAGQQFMFVVILLIVTIGVVNTLLMSVLERSREFGVIMALGATPGTLRRLLLSEALLLGGAGLLAGTPLGSLLTWYLVEHGIDLRTWLPDSLEFGGVVFDPIMRAAWDLAWMARIALYVFGLSLLAALYPALKAGRSTPAAVMRKN